MVVCIIALFVFGFLGIFSAKYRPFAKEAFRCVFRRMTLRKCDTSFDQKMKAKITGKLMLKWPKLASFVYKRFEILSWLLTILLIVSLVLTANGFYNLAKYGSCDPHSTKCIFNPGHLSCESEHCLENGCTCETVGCEEPTHKACEGNCTCKTGTCG